jgi:hypothetical protein
MPTEIHFINMSLPEILIEIADYHSKPATRHITKFEKQSLYRAAKLLKSIEE